MNLDSGKRTGSGVPFWRDERYLGVITQALFLAAFALVVIWASSNYLSRGLKFGFGFLRSQASFDLSEGIAFKPTDTYAKAFLVGVVNTIRVAVIGIIISSVLGFFIGIARLSSNWLVNKMASVYVNVLRNTPLLVQLFFFYFAVVLKMPKMDSAVVFLDSFFLSNRGIVFPWIEITDSFIRWLPYLVISIAGAVYLIVLRNRKKHVLGRPSFSFVWVVLFFAGVSIIGYLIAGGNSLTLDIPVLITRSGGVKQISGGLRFSAEFTAMLFGLSVYTSAYIAEVVRSGIQAVPKGQTEAARAQGFTGRQILRLIVLPQALRVIIPPLISQYLNLTKNSSLAIAIGFLDLYAVSQTMLNQSGRVVEVFLLIMGAYLSMSLSISFIMNIVNKKIQIIER